LPIPADKELSDLQGRLWSVCFSDDFVRVYTCVRSKNQKKQQLRLEFRCERIAGEDGDAVVADVGLRFPAGVSALEVDASGLLPLATGALGERAAKVRATLGLAPFLVPALCTLAAEVQYTLTRGGAPERIASPLDLTLPSTTFLTHLPTSEDEIATYMADHAAELLTEQTAEAVTLQMPGRAAGDVASELPGLVGRCAGLCNLYGIQQQAPAQNKSQKFLMVARPPAASAQPSPLAGQVALPEAARVVCLCAGMPRDGSLDIKVTVKACRKDVCDDVSAQLVSVFRDLVEGRLRTVG